jgi:hypothetical protein
MFNASRLVGVVSWGFVAHKQVDVRPGIDWFDVSSVPVIAAYVEALGWNNDFIIARCHGVEPYAPDKQVSSTQHDLPAQYWIIGVRNREVVGPFGSAEIATEQNRRHIPDLKLKGVSHLDD